MTVREAARADRARKASGGDLKPFILPTLPPDAAGIGRWKVGPAYIAPADAHPEIAHG